MKTTIANRFASVLAARNNCQKAGSTNNHWYERHGEVLERLMKEAPSGSGFDAGTQFQESLSTPEKLVFYTQFHHLNPDGYYDGWTEHTIYVKGSLLLGISLNVTGKNRNGIKDYIYEVFRHWLSTEVDHNYGYQSEVQTAQSQEAVNET